MDDKNKKVNVNNPINNNQQEEDDKKKKKGIAFWWKHLNKGTKIGLSILAGAGVTTAVVVPTVIAVNNSKQSQKDVSIDTSVSHVSKCELKENGDNYEISFTVDEGYEITGIEKITINGEEFKDYKFEGSKIIIAKTTLEKHSGKIVVTPCVILKNREVNIDESVKDLVSCSTEIVDNKLRITLNIIEGYGVNEIEKILIGETELTESEYIFLNNKIIIESSILDTHKGTIVVTPKVESKVVSLTIVSNPNRWVYAVGDTVSKPGSKNTLDLTGLKVNALMVDGSTIDVTDKVKVDYDLDHEFTKDDISEDKEIKVKYTDKEDSFHIAVHDTFDTYFKYSYYLELKDGAKLPKHILIPSKLNDVEVKDIRGDCFQNNDEIESIDMSYSNVQIIWQYSFENCTKLKKISLNEGLKYIGDSMGCCFSNCSSLEELHLPSTFLSLLNVGEVMYNDYCCFQECKKLKTIYIDSDTFANKTYNLKYDFSIYSYAENIYVKEGIDIKPDSYIGKCTTQGTSTKTGYNLYRPKELIYTALGTNPETYSVSSGIISKENFEIPSTYNDCDITKILTDDGFGFRNNSTIKNLTLPEKIQVLGANAFDGCCWLEFINIPESVTSIGDDCFNDCFSLTTILLDNQTYIDSATSPGGLYDHATKIYIKKGTTVPSSSYICKNFNNDGPSSTKEGYEEWIKNS